jgi:hypothetical protein
MRKRIMNLSKRVILASTLSLLLATAARADAPGSYFLDFPERMALVVEPSGKSPKATISEHAAKELIEGAQPLSAATIVLMYQGKIYIVPDRKMSDARMASDMVKSLIPK